MDVPIVFLSHSALDREVARSLKEVLATHTKGEIEWWLSSDGQSIRGGKNWRAEVEKALRECRLLFILFTPTSQRSAWVQFEAGFADALGKDIVPIALPGFDVDAIPGPLQHKQGFNLRGASGLNNILSVTNQILARHDLLSLDNRHYQKVFGGLSNQNETLRILDAYVETIDLSAEGSEKSLKRFTSELRRVTVADFRMQWISEQRVLAGPGFVLREVTRNPADRAKSADQRDVKPLYYLQGQLTASGLFELLPAFASKFVNDTLSKGGSLEWKLQKGVAVLTSQARILGNMRGTLMRFAYENVFSFGNFTFAPRAYDANARAEIFQSYPLDAPPEPYVPQDWRYEFLLQWDSPFESDRIKEMLTLLIERHVIFVNSDRSA